MIAPAGRGGKMGDRARFAAAVVVGEITVDAIRTELSRLGLTPDESRCYLELLKRGRLTARLLSETTGVPRGRIYDVVGGLLAKGVAVEMASDVRSFEAVPPEVGVSNLLEKRRRDVDELEDSARQIVDALTETAARPDTPPVFVEWLRHRATVWERCNALEEAAEEEILFFIRGPFSESVDIGSELRALARGVRLRALYETSLLTDAYAELIQGFVDAGGEARHVPSLPTKLMVFDNSVTMVPLEAEIDSPNYTVLVIRHPGISTIAAAGFELLWRDAEPIQFPARRRHAVSS